MRLKIDIQDQGLIGLIDDITKKHVPFALALALTKTAQAAKVAVQEEMKAVFDRPTPYTLNSVRVVPATKAKLFADVLLKDEAPKGTPPSKYLQAEIEGGGRRQKRSERALAFRGILPQGMQTAPGEGAKLDSYGNLRGSTITSILSAIGGQIDTAQNATPASKAKAKSKKRAQYFTPRPGSKLAPGVYQRKPDGGIMAVLVFIKPPTYRRLFRFQETIGRVFDQTFRDNLQKAMAQAIATAK